MTEDGEVLVAVVEAAGRAAESGAGGAGVAVGEEGDVRAWSVGEFESGVPVFFREWCGAYKTARERAVPLMMRDVALIMGMGMLVEHTYPAEEPMVAR